MNSITQPMMIDNIECTKQSLWMQSNMMSNQLQSNFPVNNKLVNTTMGRPSIYQFEITAWLKDLERDHSLPDMDEHLANKDWTILAQILSSFNDPVIVQIAVSFGLTFTQELLKLNYNKSITSHMLPYVFAERHYRFNVELAQYLLSLPYTDVNYSDGTFETPLTYAIVNDNYDAVKMLLEHPDINVNLPEKESAYRTIFRPLANNQYGISELLVQHPNFDFNVVDLEGKTLVDNCLQSRMLSILDEPILEDTLTIDESLTHNFLIQTIDRIDKDNIDIFKKIYALCDPEWTNQMGETWLILCLRKNKFKYAESLINDVDLKPVDVFGKNTLLWAVESNNVSFVTQLLDIIDDLHVDEQATILNQVDKNGSNVLNKCLANYFLYKQVIEQLLEYDFLDVNQQPYQEDTPLITAINNGNKELFSLLLEHDRLDINTCGTNGLTPLMIALIYFERFKINDYTEYSQLIFEVLNHPDLDLNKKNTFGDSVLMMILMRMNEDYYNGTEVQEHVDNQIEPVFANWAYYPKCYEGSFNSNNTLDKWYMALFSILTDRNGIDLNTTDLNGNGLLAASIFYKNQYCFKYLLQSDLDINALNHVGQNALIYNLLSNTSPTIKQTSVYQPLNQPVQPLQMMPADGGMLYGSPGLDLHELNAFRQGRSPREDILPVTVEKEDDFSYYVNALLDDQRFDRESVEYSGRNLLHCVIKLGYWEQYLRLLEDGVDLNAVDCFGNTPLMYAVEAGIKYFKPLLDRGVNVDVVNYKGKQVEHFAKSDRVYYTFLRLAGLQPSIGQHQDAPANQDNKGGMFGMF